MRRRPRASRRWRGHLRISRRARPRRRRARRADSSPTYHSACSLQHGQKITTSRRSCWHAAGFGQGCARRASVLRLGRHLQHPAAGLAAQAARPQGREYRARARRDRRRQYRLHHADRAGTAIPVVHPVELIDWATGGPDPRRPGVPARGLKRPRWRCDSLVESQVRAATIGRRSWRRKRRSRSRQGEEEGRSGPQERCGEEAREGKGRQGKPGTKAKPMPAAAKA